ncbi:MAG: zincin-like metallopeptidase domain-containing protein [Legionella sp.]|uniref:zincin-like metallopeptidase domain-containing protein n=1 Tax=Legionella sp. TaxID=459 RepID=UPI0039E69D40
MDKLPYHQQVANQIIEQLKEGTAPWLIPWEEGQGGRLPFNPLTGTRYKGINALYLMAHNIPDNRWLTYKQAQSLGAQVKKGEKGTTIQYWKFSEERIQKDEQNNPIKDEHGNVLKVRCSLERPRVFYATVFNATQIEGLPPLIVEERHWALLDKAESILAESGANIIHSESDRAFYRKSTDSIHLPLKNQFKTAARYYATALHELSHWTGHSSRLDRDLNHPFGSEGYAREELRAEIASLMLGDELGIGHDPSQHTAYIKSWIKLLKEDPLELFRASSDAEKIRTYITSLMIEQQHEVVLTQDQQLMDELNKARDSMSVPIQKEERIWLNIPFHQKETVKELMSKSPSGESMILWDKDMKKWYAHSLADLERLKPWRETNSQTNTEEVVFEKTWLAIPFSQKDTAKSVVGHLPDGTLGIAWDHQEKCWYAKPGVALNRIKPWISENIKSNLNSKLDPITEFKEALMSLGCIVTDEHPIMDGKKHRITAEGDKNGEKAGFYVGHLDGIPAGYIKNNRTGIDLKWKSKGYVLTEEEKAHLKAISMEKLKNREEEQECLHKNTAGRLMSKLNLMQTLTEPTPYIEAKGITVHPGIYTDKGKKTMCIPAFDAEGILWNIQYIQENGTKRFAKDSRKEGCFHVVGGFDCLAKAPVIVIAEGYATAATLSESLEMPVVSAFDAGNMKLVAQALNQKFPQIPVLIAGDDDRYQEKKQGMNRPANPGKEQAIEAARSVNGFVVFPIFSSGEQEKNPKQFSDFNDLAKNSVLGRDGVLRQVKPVIDKILANFRSVQQKSTNKKILSV